VVSGNSSDQTEIRKMGESAGFTFRKVGWLGRFFGNCPCAALIASSTSVAAASMLRDRSNCTVTVVEPSTLIDVIWLRPLICENCVSSGSATELAITSGLAPG
jgi:hypothetical protein